MGSLLRLAEYGGKYFVLYCNFMLSSRVFKNKGKKTPRKYFTIFCFFRVEVLEMLLGILTLAGIST